MTLNEEIRKLISDIAKTQNEQEKAEKSQLLAWLIELEQGQEKKKNGGWRDV